MPCSNEIPFTLNNLPDCDNAREVCPDFSTFGIVQSCENKDGKYTISLSHYGRVRSFAVIGEGPIIEVGHLVYIAKKGKVIEITDLTL